MTFPNESPTKCKKNHDIHDIKFGILVENVILYYKNSDHPAFLRMLTATTSSGTRLSTYTLHATT